MTDAKTALDNIVSTISEFTDDELLTMQRVIERTYVHLMIERSLRDGDRMSSHIERVGSG